MRAALIDPLDVYRQFDGSSIVRVKSLGAFAERILGDGAQR